MTAWTGMGPDKPVRKCRIVDDVAYVPLTQGCEAIIDSSDLHLVDGHNWFVHKKRNTAYAATSWPRSGGETQHVLMHRLLIPDVGDALVDHIDGNGLNNRRSNIRQATQAENLQNVPRRRLGISGLRGAHWNGRNKTWVSQITAHGKVHNLGIFPTAEAAHDAYREASLRLHGEFSPFAPRGGTQETPNGDV